MLGGKALDCQTELGSAPSSASHRLQTVTLLPLEWGPESLLCVFVDDLPQLGSSHRVFGTAASFEEPRSPGPAGPTLSHAFSILS